MNDKDKINIGKDSVVMGNVQHQNIGDRSVVIGPTDSNGNTILSGTMAVGYGARAGENSIAIGAYAGAGSNLFHLLNNLESAVDQNGSEVEKVLVKKLKEELKASHPNKDVLQKIWQAVNALKWSAETWMLIQQIAPHVLASLK